MIIFKIVKGLPMCKKPNFSICLPGIHPIILRWHPEAAPAQRGAARGLGSQARQGAGGHQL